MRRESCSYKPSRMHPSFGRHHVWHFDPCHCYVAVTWKKKTMYFSLTIESPSNSPTLPASPCQPWVLFVLPGSTWWTCIRPAVVPIEILQDFPLSLRVHCLDFLLKYACRSCRSIGEWLHMHTVSQVHFSERCLATVLQLRQSWQKAQKCKQQPHSLKW